MSKNQVKNNKEKTERPVEWLTNSTDYTRKFRPKKLSEIVGQDMTKHIVKGMVKTMSLPGAIMIHGRLGYGKTTIARIIAAVVNCQNPDSNGDACQECSSCKALYGETNKHPDYLEINAAQHTGIDDIRALQERISYKPKYNRLVVALDEVHRLSRQAMEGLLKSIETPASHVTFILITTEPQGIIETLQSRCVKLRIADVAPQKNMELLKRVCKEEKLKLGDEVLEMICAKANNIPRECLTMLQGIANALASGDIDEKELSVEGMESKISELMGVPSYIAVQQYLVGIYKGKMSGAMLALRSATSKPNFMKSCIDVHTNVLMSITTKTPENVIAEKWILGQTKKIVSDAGLVRSADLLKSMGLLLADLIDMYTKMSQYQLGDSSAPLVTVAAKWCSRFGGSE